MASLLELVKGRANILKVEMDDSYIDYTIEEVSQYVLNYCNLTVLPKGLYHLVAKIVVASLSDYQTQSAPIGQVAKSIKVGDTQVELGDDHQLNALDDSMNRVLSDYLSQLNTFRKVSW